MAEKSPVLRNKEDLRKLFPPDIAGKLRYEEDPENSVIWVYLDSLGYWQWGRFLQSISQISAKYGRVQPKRVRGFWKSMIRLTPPHRDYAYAVSYKPASEQKAKNLELAGRYEEAAQEYEVLAMLEEAGRVRRLEKVQYVISTNFQIGEDGTVKLVCPHCGASQPAESKTSEVTCKYCGKRYAVPRKILDMI